MERMEGKGIEEIGMVGYGRQGEGRRVRCEDFRWIE